MTPFLNPLDGRFGPPGPHWAGGPPPFLSLLGALMFCLLLLLIAAGLFFATRRGSFGPPPWVRHGAPETEAKKVLAERFARGDISTDEFLERASVLNWTPGTEPWEPGKKKR